MDPDQIRNLLLDIRHERRISFSEAEDGSEVIEQLLYLEDKGYVKLMTPDKEGRVVERLTADGHDFARAVERDTVWRRTREKLSKATGAVTLELIKATAEGVARASMS